MSKVPVVLCLTGVLALAVPSPAIGEEVVRSRYLMGTPCEATIPVGRNDGAPGQEEAVAAIEAAFDEIARLEKILSDYRPDSELSRLNGATGEGPVTCSEDLYRFVAEASLYSVITDGAFDITVGPLVGTWDLRGKGRLATPGEVDSALSRVGHSRLALDSDHRTIRFQTAGMVLDPGAMGKGFALDATADLLQARGIDNALIDFGGQILALGAPQEAGSWEISIANPEDRLEPVLTLRLRDASIATSGNSERGLRVDGRDLGHVLDPRSGQPIDTWGSVTVVSKSGTAADAVATAMLVMGSEAAMGWAERHPGFSVLFLSLDGEGNLVKRATPGFFNLYTVRSASVR